MECLLLRISIQIYFTILIGLGIRFDKNIQGPCESGSLVWFSVYYSISTDILSVAENNIDFSIPPFVGSKQSSMMNIGCLSENQYYCALAYLVTDIDPVTEKPKPGKHPVCVIKRSNI